MMNTHKEFFFLFQAVGPLPLHDYRDTNLKARFDTFLVGRRLHEAARGMGECFGGKRVIVASKTLRMEDHPEVKVFGERLEQRIRELREEDALDVWSHGGGSLFGKAFARVLVDTIGLAILPFLLSCGVPFLSEGKVPRKPWLFRDQAHARG